jgi:spore maturation protein CgeB
MKLLIIGYNQPGQMGNYLASAAERLGLNYRIMDMSKAETASRILQSYYWRFRDRRPANLAGFASEVLDTCAEMKPDVVLTTGTRAPLERSHIEKIRQLGAKVINYSTDDPWNSVLRSEWFLSTLTSYDAIFTPRRSNIDDFHRWGVREIHYLPFAHDPEIHRPWSDSVSPCDSSDILFVGGCDSERLPLISALAESGFKLALFGRYWNRDPKTRIFWRGVADHDIIRAASANAAICLCLVRRANRDGHVMRSYEAAAIGGCILAEDTPEHREIFGPEMHAACYFKTIPEMVQRAKILKSDVDLRRRLSRTLGSLRTAGTSDTYADRLVAMLRLTGIEQSSSATAPA